MDKRIRSRSAPGLAQARRVAMTMVVIALTAVVLIFATPRAYTQTKPPQPDAPAIVGGREATPGEWPWQVALIVAGGDPYNGQFCGGTLIHPRWVVTAAHCADGAQPSDLQVLAGIHNLVETDPNYARIDVERIIIHPDYAQVSQYDSDIALLELATAAPFRPGTADRLPIAPSAMVAFDVGQLVGVESTVTGWGNRQPGGIDYPATLHEVEVPIISNTACATAYGDRLTANMVCAGLPEGGRDSCQGDSGGPLVVFNNDRSRWELAGIVSWGFGCAQPGLPGVYTRLSAFLPWIVLESGVGESDFFVTLNPATLNTCAGTTVQTQVGVTAVGGFDEVVALSQVGLPAGGSASFQPPSLTPPGSSTFRINTNNVAGGQYDVLVRGMAGSVIHGATLSLAVAADAPARPQLLQPPPNTVGVPVAASFVWSAVPQALRYRLEIATDIDFQDVIYSASLEETAHTPDEWLEPQRQYYWRVRAENACGPGQSWAVSRLTTGDLYCRQPNLAIPDTETVSDTMTVNAAGTVRDMDVFVQIDHTFVGDLEGRLTHVADSAQVLLWESSFCGGDDVTAIFDDEGAPLSCEAGPPAYGGRVVPAGTLAAFDNRPLAGAWTLRVADTISLDIGTLKEWCLMPTLDRDYCDGVTDVPAAECAALESLFTQSDGWQWGNPGGWLNGTRACNWLGVDCAGGHVTEVRLPNNGLTGPLTAAVGDLPQLRVLDLSDNAGLSGLLPNRLTDLSLTLFHFDGTALCAPTTADFVHWLDGIGNLLTSGRSCTTSFLPFTRR